MTTRLASIYVERRCLALTIFQSTHLDHAETRSLSSDNQKAEDTASALSNRLAADYDLGAVSMELATNGDIRKTILTDILVASFRDHGIPVFQASKLELLSAFGKPPLTTRKELVTVAAEIWPSLYTRGLDTSILSAAALGLYFQVERMFAD